MKRRALLSLAAAGMLLLSLAGPAAAETAPVCSLTSIVLPWGATWLIDIVTGLNPTDTYMAMVIQPNGTALRQVLDYGHTYVAQAFVLGNTPQHGKYTAVLGLEHGSDLSKTKLLSTTCSVTL